MKENEHWFFFSERESLKNGSLIILSSSKNASFHSQAA